jgi:p-hydroxybenzoate 3-monooxygenase
VRVLADALVQRLSKGDDALLQGYSEACLGRIWAAQHFAWWMTTMFHRQPGDEDGFMARLQRAQLDYVCSSKAAATTLAENYVGLKNVGGGL